MNKIIHGKKFEHLAYFYARNQNKDGFEIIIEWVNKKITLGAMEVEKLQKQKPQEN